MTGSDRHCLRVLVAGRVQGVSFRAFTRQQALARGVSGWAKNLADGRVEAMLEGRSEDLEALLRALRRGPIHARVDDLQSEPVQPRGFSDFTIG